LILRGGKVITLASGEASAVGVTGERTTAVGSEHLDREGLKGLLPEGAGGLDATRPVDCDHARDRASTEHPILIRCAWGYWAGHLPLVSVANSAALEFAGVRRGSSPSPLLEIDADAGGEPSGIFFEHAFQPLAEFTLFRKAPQFTADDRLRTLARVGRENVPISLWPCIWQAVERVDRETGAVIAPDQRISREEALECATTHGAWLCLDEEQRGTKAASLPT
jgi:predicted amidohydrolase YtcJ